MKESLSYVKTDKNGKPKYTEIYMDITNKCNAKCKYCLTGQANLKGISRKIPEYNLKVEDFEAMVNHLIEHEIITEDAWFRIYNWYEPLLSPNLPEIINYCYDKGLGLDISTNASKKIDFSKIKSMEHFRGFLFSMPGFSQKSYNKMHGFDFELIKDNIEYLTKGIREKGFEGDIFINYHLYQHNFSEVKEAKEFADKLGIRLNTIFAYFNGGADSRSYLEGTMSSSDLKKYTKDIFLYYLEDIFEDTEYYIHRLSEPETITLSEKLNIIPGRGSNDDDAIKSVFDVTSYDDMKKIYDPFKEKILKDPIAIKSWVWAHNYKVGRNYLFGFEDKEYEQI